jgi:hypothetical protein
VKFFEAIKVTRKKGKCVVDLTLKSYDIGTPTFDVKEQIVYVEKADLIRNGYRKCEGYKTELAYWKIPVYMKLHNFRKCDYARGYCDEFGRPCKEGEGVP